MPKKQTDKSTEQATPSRSPTMNPRVPQTYMHRNQPVHVPQGYLAVGRITGLHGLKGEVKIELHTDFPERFVPGAVLFMGEELVETAILQARPHKNQMLLL